MAQTVYAPNFYDTSLTYFRPPMLEYNRPVVIFSDTQRTSWMEEFFLGREQNDYARSRLIKKIVDEKPAMVIHLGDMVFDASSKEEFLNFDFLTLPLRIAHIPLFPLMGNHEYWGNNQKATRNIRSRFIELRKVTWYHKRFLDLAFLFLDTNKDDLGERLWAQQKRWFQLRLKSFQNNPSIKGIVVLTHHPPFTNSDVTSDEIHVQKAFLPLFYKTSKAFLFVSGHAHGYERFIKKGKHFLVTAGGGGPRVDYKDFDHRKHQDFFRGKRPRPFHFLTLIRKANSVEIAVKGFYKKRPFKTYERYVVPF